MEPKGKLEDYILLRALAKGGFGFIFLAEHKETKKKCVMKQIIKTTDCYGEIEAEIHNEMKIMSQCDSPFVVKLHDFFEDGAKGYIIMEYCEDGSLLDVMHEHARTEGELIPEKTICEMFAEIVQGLEHLHSRKIIHRDIKPQNILVTHKIHCKLGDLGLSKQRQTSLAKAYSGVGTKGYAAPEIIAQQPYGPEVDIYSLGISICELALGSLANKTEHDIADELRRVIPTIAPIVIRMISHIPADRPTAATILTHPAIVRGRTNAAEHLALMQRVQEEKKLTHCPHCAGTEHRRESAEQRAQEAELRVRAAEAKVAEMEVRLANIASQAPPPPTRSKWQERKWKQAEARVAELEALLQAKGMPVPPKGRSVSPPPMTPPPMSPPLHRSVSPPPGGAPVHAEETRKPDALAKAQAAHDFVPASHFPWNHSKLGGIAEDRSAKVLTRSATCDDFFRTSLFDRVADRGVWRFLVTTKTIGVEQDGSPAERAICVGFIDASATQEPDSAPLGEGTVIKTSCGYCGEDGALVHNNRRPLGNSPFKFNDTVTIEVDLSSTPRTAHFFVNDVQQPSFLINIPRSVRFGVSFYGTGAMVAVVLPQLFPTPKAAISGIRGLTAHEWSK